MIWGWYPNNFLERMRKTTQTSVRILDVPRETRTECLLNKSSLVRLRRLVWKRNGPGVGCMNAHAEKGVVSRCWATSRPKANFCNALPTLITLQYHLQNIL